MRERNFISSVKRGAVKLSTPPAELHPMTLSSCSSAVVCRAAKNLAVRR